MVAVEEPGVDIDLTELLPRAWRHDRRRLVRCRGLRRLRRLAPERDESSQRRGDRARAWTVPEDHRLAGYYGGAMAEAAGFGSRS
jgi:hypothetical protein